MKTRWCSFTFLLFLLVGVAQGTAAQRGSEGFRHPVVYMPDLPQPAHFQPATTDNTVPHYGVNFISSAEDLADEQQYQNGLSTGATWNRFPIYWFNVEESAGTFDWSEQDEVVQADMTHSLQVNAILLGTPTFYLTGDYPQQSLYETPISPLSLTALQTATPLGLYEPIFSDGTDLPALGKTINPNNKWAVFVSAAIHRYKPGGELAQANGWSNGEGITHWEIWNEPDLASFWDGSKADYARLLKVGYLAAKQADPSAQVIFGALANASGANYEYYNDILNFYESDPLAEAYGHFHDILATHSYYYAWNSWLHVYRAGNTMSEHGFNKPIWLDETGVPAWNDYPGPVWDEFSWFRATTSEQANYTIQTTFYALFAGAEAIFHFQLYDGCGNQPRGTDFPPHNGELCDENGMYNGFPCAGDANGLFRNPTDAACFTQHPQPETARPNKTAYQLLTTYLQEVQPLWRERPGGTDPYNGPQEWIAFYRPATGERIVGLWARYGNEEWAEMPALSPSATLITPDGITQTITPVNGIYSLTLPAATNQNKPPDWDPALYPIGGRPYILIEPDQQPPTVALTAYRVGPGDDLSLNWSGDDGLGSGMQNYTLWVSVNGSSPTLWLENSPNTNAIYAGDALELYQFTLMGRDLAGNESALVTVDVLPFTEHAYLPTLRK